MSCNVNLNFLTSKLVVCDLKSCIIKSYLKLTKSNIIKNQWTCVILSVLNPVQCQPSRSMRHRHRPTADDVNESIPRPSDLTTKEAVSTTSHK